MPGFSKSITFSVMALLLFNLSTITSGKVRRWNLASYQHYQQHRLKTGSSSMYVSLYEHENFRGKVHRQTIARNCTNVPQEFNDWASSITLRDHCVILCDEPDCNGLCTSFYPNQKGLGRLRQYGLNDKVSSVKYCYRFR